MAIYNLTMDLNECRTPLRKPLHMSLYVWSLLLLEFALYYLLLKVFL